MTKVEIKDRIAAVLDGTVATNEAIQVAKANQELSIKALKVTKKAEKALADAKAAADAAKTNKLQARKDAKKAKRAEKTAVKTAATAIALEGTVGKAHVLANGGKAAWRKVKKAIKAGNLSGLKVQGEWTIKTSDFENFDLASVVKEAGGKTSKVKNLEEQLSAAVAAITTLQERITLLELAAYEQH